MFGKDREEDYELYNQRVNAKYDDDYISPSVEERQECYHDHEQTYKNYDIPQQKIQRTYTDETSSKSYESPESRFSTHLRTNERILWIGEMEKDATNKELGSQGCVSCLVVFILIFFVPSFASFFFSAITSPMPAVGIIPLLVIVTVIIAVVKLASRFRTIKIYAVTNQRVLSLSGNVLSSGELKYMQSAKAQDFGRNIGTVSFLYSNYTYDNNLRCTTFAGVRNPDTVKSIVNEAAYRAKKPAQADTNINSNMY